ncbi:hypothetical protein PHSC3_001176 [Chlamydiales bacterium STE3]|nr:hypothetical protein PHSC3_001176 [Chlamydiales bacterium STE3]
MNPIINYISNFFNKVFLRDKVITPQDSSDIDSTKILYERINEAYEPKSQNNPLYEPKLQGARFKDTESEEQRITEKFDEFGEATAKRSDTFQQNREIQFEKIKYYEELLKEILDNQQAKPILDIIKQGNRQEIVNAIQQLNHENQNTLLSICTRLALAHQIQSALDKQTDTAWAPSTFIRQQWSQDKIQEIPSVPVNLRAQSFSSEVKGTKPFDFARLGVFFDARDPGNTIQELELYLEKGANSKELETEVKRRENLLQKYAKKGDETRAKAIEQSLIPLKMIQKEQTSLLKAFIEEKKGFIDDQMLQLVLAQIESREPLLESAGNNTSFFMAHLGLLNEKKVRVDASGLIHDEGRFMVEMQQAFKRFEGKKIIIDGTGPLIDQEGNIHLKTRSFSSDGKTPKELTLRTLFANFSVQGFTQNGPVQGKFNETTATQFNEELTKQIKSVRAELKENQDSEELIAKASQLESIQSRLDTIIKSLTQGQSNYKIACDYFPLLLEYSQIAQGEDAIFTSSLCCFSGKDRTGLVAAVSTHRVGVKKAVEALEQDTKKQQNILRKFSKRILYDKDSLGIQVVSENTGASMLKVSPLFLPEVANSIKSIARRVFHYVEQAFANLSS